MARKVAVVGMGNVGATVAHYLIAGGFTDDLVLIDPREEKVVADAVDFEDAMANLEYHTNIFVNDYEALADADVVVSALGNIKLQDNPDDDRFAELPYTRVQVKKVATKLKEVTLSSPLGQPSGSWGSQSSKSPKRAWTWWPWIRQPAKVASLSFGARSTPATGWPRPLFAWLTRFSLTP